MALPEDAAAVLEQFVHDVANIPAEITHLMEEIQAKDMQISAFKDEINKRDVQLQKWVRTNGGHVLNPKEEAFSKTINECYDKCEVIQAQKLGLSEKALKILERQIKRLDTGLRGLAQTEQFPSDWGGPSLLSATPTGASTPITGQAGMPLPLQVVSGNIGSTGGAPNIANAAQIRLAQNAAAGIRNSPGAGQALPTSASRSSREGSSEANKRRRLNASIGNLPTASSNLRQSSLGPGTPKPGTPNPSSNAPNSSRAGSAQPARPTAGHKKNPSSAIGNPARKPPPTSSTTSKKSRSRPKKSSDRRRQLARDRTTTPSTNASLSGSDDENETSHRDGDGSPSPSSALLSQADGGVDKIAEDDEGDDETLYCLCHKVSYGDMVGCDNDNCQYQWFHYKCVGVTEEPKGEWLCPSCRALPRSKLRVSRD
ncbi:unnamed protein product [Zymoseptoria tritici ST99CH_1A5]|uniref:Chromatin modification-related protein n=2 Tax=Zymoseptoria tritici TaxID=1047171 RepID=A0A2H1FJ42_ZYMTR|nr:unnamed protein product [Zymoseptoria tritici ST99CH_1E4]SMR43454.1 unnamed protein product [Zymoseptoria tritici ST99CH_3D1]SMY18600.1 unnamed protein product [Zymoseptoria tritici ST99CH_1A5]